jgi:molybdopterin/thiamine biosynthesis adenylyltransferase
VSGGAATRFARVERLRGADIPALRNRRAVVVGCGALGSLVATFLVRSGVGHVRVVDRDLVEQRNLLDQILFTEVDASEHRTKADAAGASLRKANRVCVVEEVVADFNYRNARELVAGADVVIDGADNLETKLLINDAALATATPFVYAGCAGSQGVVMAVRPGKSHCLRCLWPNPVRLRAIGCEQAGVLPGTIAATAGLQFNEAIKLLLGLESDVLGLVRIDVWDGTIRHVRLHPYVRGNSDCAACGLRDFAYLDGRQGLRTQALCGVDAILISPLGNQHVDLDRLVTWRKEDPSLKRASGFIRFEADDCTFLVFASGRTLVHGAGTPERAKALHARHVLEAMWSSPDVVPRHVGSIRASLEAER